ncbi:thioredoxin reductase (NADPH) [Abditibacterium utsteinense]|uniref:Thioredoxin reductase (NADPH) n=1 Tax=Abditibacterium utsteinense TaxID=1960156 RepID=A0A2S8SS47_9BACT|nr:FAD-dependent oxidoreductase [Abditibacterium utsteinense]PQV63631.1 thioredoxin reductase (NADPH) [Abditibacterium utsteinense]
MNDIQNGIQHPNSGDEVRNVIIIGSGPTGYTAALYTARANLQPLLIAGSADKKTARIKGGQLMATSDIENFPGAIETKVDLDSWAYLDDEAKTEATKDVKGLSGPHLMTRMELQARHFGTEMLEEFVTEIDICSHPGELYTVQTESGKIFKTRSLIIATGAAAKTMGIEAEDKFFGQGGGVSTCATCDGHSYRGKTVAVVGGGDSAMEEASYLANLGIKVHLIHRREEFRASKIMVDRAKKNPNIEIHTFRAIVDLKGKPHPLAETSAFFKDKEVLSGAILENTQTKEREELRLDGVFVAIGHTPNSSLFKDQLKMDEAGYLERDRHMRAIPSVNACNRKMHGMEHVPGIFVAGDVSDHIYRQAITAAGMGCMAAIEAERYIAEKLAEEVGMDANALDLSAESIAQSHWSSEREEMGEKPMVERVIEAAKV